MSEICPECFNKIHNTNYRKDQFVLENSLEYCENCAKMKKCVITVAKTCVFSYFKKLLYKVFKF